MAWSLAVTLSALASCSDPGATAGRSKVFDQPFSVRDSAGVSLKVTAGSAAFAALPWVIDQTPHMTLGAGVAEGAEFFRVTGLWGTRNGGVVVLDAGSREVRFFDSDGRLLERLGGRGDGPGEYQDPVMVPTMSRDSIAIWDTYHRRVDFVSLTDLGRRTVPLRDWPAGGRPPLASFGTLFVARATEPFRAEEMRSPGLMLREYSYAVLDPESQTRAPIAAYVEGRSFLVGDRGRVRGLDVVPLTVDPSVAVGPKGVFLTRGLNLTIRLFSAEGIHKETYRVIYSPPPTTAQIVDSLKRMRLGPDPSPRVAADIALFFGQVPIPDSLPAIQAMSTDARGNLWVELYRWSPDAVSRWLVFDTGGRALGTIELPHGLELRWVGEDYVLGVAQDEMGVESVQKYALRREE